MSSRWPLPNFYTLLGVWITKEEMNCIGRAACKGIYSKVSQRGVWEAHVTGLPVVDNVGIVVIFVSLTSRSGLHDAWSHSSCQRSSAGHRGDPLSPSLFLRPTCPVVKARSRRTNNSSPCGFCRHRTSSCLFPHWCERTAELDSVEHHHRKGC